MNLLGDVLMIVSNHQLLEVSQPCRLSLVATAGPHKLGPLQLAGSCLSGLSWPIRFAVARLMVAVRHKA